MKYAIFSFTYKAALLSSIIHTNVIHNQDCCVSYTTIKQEYPPYIEPLTLPLKEQIKDVFYDVDAIIFVSACAIAVRTIAPLLKSKTTDPAVIVIDELGQYAISLLSGHIGGGNTLTKQLAMWIGATPIISTATDLNNLFAVDVFATYNNLYIDNMQLAKEISSALLNGNEIAVISDFPTPFKFPQQLTVLNHNQLSESSSFTNKPTLGIAITLDSTFIPFPKTLHLIPKVITLGIGCKKFTHMEQINTHVRHTLSQYHVSIHAVRQVASIDLKAKEQGLLDFCKAYKLPFQTYTAEELSSIDGEFTSSSFVQSITGIDNVCERAALYQAPTGRFLFRKTAMNGVTVAAVIEEFELHYE